MQKLLDYISSIPTGKIQHDLTLQTLLADAWDLFSGSSNNCTAGFKLVGRMENIHWDQPILSFEIERHGGTVNGSSRADLHKWTVNMSSFEAMSTTGRRRQLEPMSPKLDVKLLAKEITILILDGTKNDRLKWESESKLKILISKIIPDDGFKQTVSGRRKRFRKEVERNLGEHHWKSLKPNLFEKIESSI